MYSSSILANRLDPQPRTKDDDEDEGDRDMTPNTYPGFNPIKVKIIVWRFQAPDGEQKTAQGFSPGNDTHKEIALKGRPNGIDYNV